MELKRLGIYVHIPFCERKCGYCDFLSAPPANEDQIQKYVHQLCLEIEKTAKKQKPTYVVNTVYIGGGTPSILTIEQITSIAEAIKAGYCLDENYEWTIEVNPNSIQRNKLMSYRLLGINRISMGLQAKQDCLLRVLGRIHTLSQFEKGFREVREAGFENVNIDLMYGLPQQTLQQWMETVDYVTGLQPEHISAYSLILEEGTPFYNRYTAEKQNALPDEDKVMLMEQYLFERMDNCGYSRYEISNFAQKGYESRHNLRYWKLDDYQGFGLGAASFFWGDPGKRLTGEKDIELYCSGGSFAQEEADDTISEMEEFAFLGLRMLDKGIDILRFEEMFGKTFEDVFSTEMIKRHCRNDLLEEIKTTSEHYLRLTRRGAEVANYVMADFLLHS